MKTEWELWKERLQCDEIKLQLVHSTRQFAIVAIKAALFINGVATVALLNFFEFLQLIIGVEHVRSICYCASMLHNRYICRGACAMFGFLSHNLTIGDLIEVGHAK